MRFSFLLATIASCAVVSSAFTTTPFSSRPAAAAAAAAAAVVHHLSSSSQIMNRKLTPSSTRFSPLFLADVADDVVGDADVSSELEAKSSDIESDIEAGPLGRIKGLLGLGKKKEEDGLSFRQKLQKAGLAVVLSYGAVSNASYGVSMSIAWYGFSKKTGLSPLAPGQWKPFLAVYSAFFIFNNIVRPIRFAVSLAVSPYFERMIQSVQKRTRLSRGVSVGLVVIAVNIFGTLSLMGAGISIASTLAGVPAIPLK